MPELPEVETIARGLAKRVTGEVIESVWLGQKKEPLKSPATEIAETLEHSRIAEVRRMGKHIVFDLERAMRTPTAGNGRASKRTAKKSKAIASTVPAVPVGDALPTITKAQWIVHLGMTGRLQVCDPEAEIAKHTHAIVKLSSGRELRFVDPRRF